MGIDTSFVTFAFLVTKILHETGQEMSKVAILFMQVSQKLKISLNWNLH